MSTLFNSAQNIVHFLVILGFIVNEIEYLLVHFDFVVRASAAAVLVSPDRTDSQLAPVYFLILLPIEFLRSLCSNLRSLHIHTGFYASVEQHNPRQREHLAPRSTH